MDKRKQVVCCASMCRRNPGGRRPNRRGISLLELLVSASILCVTVTVVTSLLFKCGMVWRDVSQRRVAVHELSSHLEELTLLDVDSVAGKIQQLKPSTLCAERLPESELTGTLVKDNLGTRVELSISWKRAVESKPVILCGWLVEAGDSK